MPRIVSGSQERKNEMPPYTGPARNRNNRNPQQRGGQAPQAPRGGERPHDSKGPDGRNRGTPRQLFDRYTQMGDDASSAGDVVLAQGYWQHAEHYLRLANGDRGSADGGDDAHGYGT